jgi:hypothetical protein
MARPSSPAMSMVGQIARAIATADGVEFEDDPGRFHRLALAALQPLSRPTEAMVDAAHEAVWSDAYWAINSRADFKEAVRAMIQAAMKV